jgi:heme o synthase
MNEATNSAITEAPTTARWQDYLELCKPRVVALMVLTALVGMYLAVPHHVPWSVLLYATLGIALAAGSAAAINHLVDRNIDALMARTSGRPLPSGRIPPQQAWYFALLLGVLSMGVLLTLVNALTAILTFLTLIGYAGVYTLYLKRATPQNIVIGGAAGAAPPLLGWVAVTGHLAPEPLLLVLIIFVWTPPHFWALAIHRYNDYAKANIPMLPVTHGVAFTRLSIVLYTLLLTAVTAMPYAIGMSSSFYLLIVSLLNARFLYWAVVLWLGKRPDAAMKTFRYSIWYLTFLFILLLVDHFFF